METPKTDPKESAPLGDTAGPDRTMATDGEASRARRNPETIGRYRILRLLGEGGTGGPRLAEWQLQLAL